MPEDLALLTRTLYVCLYFQILVIVTLFSAGQI